MSILTTVNPRSDVGVDHVHVFHGSKNKPSVDTGEKKPSWKGRINPRRKKNNSYNHEEKMVVKELHLKYALHLKTKCTKVTQPDIVAQSTNN